jgi:hypothetical protein
MELNYLLVFCIFGGDNASGVDELADLCLRRRFGLLICWVVIKFIDRFLGPICYLTEALGISR